MNNIFSIVLYSIIIVSSLLYIWHELLNKKINFRDYKIYITFFGIMIFSICNYFIVDKFIRIILLTFVFMFYFKYLFNEKLQKCIITPIFYQVIIMICETLAALLLPILFNFDIRILLETNWGVFITNVIVAFLSILLIKIKYIKKFYMYIIKIVDKIKINKLVIFCMFVIIALSVFPMTIYYRVKFAYLLIFYSTMIISCFAIVLYLFKTQNNFNKVTDKYNIAINSLKDYENMMTKYRIANHENKNLLLTIRAMIVNKEKNIPKYIDTIIENKYEDDEKLLFKMSVIPTGGLRATIYSEILKIRENNINYSLNIDNSLSAIDLIQLDERTIVDICKVIGVLIDNAIDAVSLLKNKNIDISLYVENNYINIKVSNNYKGKIEIDKIYEIGYTTKGNGHGFGLASVKQIIKNNKLLQNKTEVNKKIFSQVLIIKYKKSP